MSAEELRGLLAKATPGPLEVVLYGDGDSLVIHEKGTDNRLCFMATPGSAGDMRRIEANADLIVAAWSYLPALLSQLDDLKGRVAELERDKARLDGIAAESWDLRCFDVPTGGDDADIGWRVIGHWMAEPRERVVAEVYHDNPRAAIDQALSALRSSSSEER